LKQTFASNPNESDNVSEMEGKRLIEKIRLRNILSFGDKGEEIELQPLNVLIGQNGSGKSNLVDVIKLSRSLPQDKGLANFISRNGGISEWIWKGKRTVNSAEIVIAAYNDENIVNYKLAFAELYQRTLIEDEMVWRDDLPKHYNRKLKEELTAEESILNSNIEFADWIDVYYPFVVSIKDCAVFTDLQTSRSSEIRKPQVPDAPNDFLTENASNLSLVLNDLEHRGDTKDVIVENLKKFNPRIKDYSIRILGGTVQLFIREEGLETPISAMRLSDGTLRYLCLLAILCHPEPPPLICIEEPETGLHPDILPTIGELLIEASKRTQLIVTTHSDILVSSFSEVPEAVLVCEADEDGTHLNRLDGEKLKGWLKKYQLGDLWIRGEIGGTRW
jgi:predicted ATPase